MSWSPYELPFQRDKFVQIVGELYRSYTDQGNAGFIDDVLSSPLTWLDTDVCALLSDTFADVPEWSLDAVLPGRSGFIAFETSPTLIDATIPGLTESARMTCDGFWWNVAGDEVSVMLITRDPRAAGFAPGLPFTLIGTFGVNRDNPQDDGGVEIDVPRAKALVGTTWLLMSQPRVIEDSDPVVVTRKQRKNRLISAPTVRVSTRTLTARYSPAGAPTGRKAEKRWWVRGHWRQQAWGKDRKLRKPVFIAPHTAGNADAPLEERPHIQVWRK